MDTGVRYCEACSAVFEDGEMYPGDECYKRVRKYTRSGAPCLLEAVRPACERPGLTYPTIDATCVNDGKAPAPYATITNPPHYARHAIQPIEFIMTNKLAYAVGNVIKYVCRYDAKGGMEDLMKARNYLDILIEDYKKDKP
jgi:hypothetical protein